MLSRRIFVASVLFLSCLAASAKNKKKILLPADVLQAKTVLVIVDPTAGVAIEDPTANRIAQEDVEKALMRWGRFSLAADASTADLIITVRKGNGKIAQPAISGIPINNRPVIVEPTDAGGRIGGQQGNPGNPADPSSASGPHPEAEVGPPEDVFAVYRSNKDDPHAAPLDAPAVWRYTAEDALQSPGVPAVEVFRKLVADAEKQLASTP